MKKSGFLPRSLKKLSQKRQNIKFLKNQKGFYQSLKDSDKRWLLKHYRVFSQGRQWQTKSDFLRVNSSLVLASPQLMYSSGLYKILKTDIPYYSQFLEWPRHLRHSQDISLFLKRASYSHQKNISKVYILLFLGKPIGVLSFNSIDWLNRKAILGYWLAKEYQKKGLMSLAIGKLISFYHTNKRLNEFEIHCIPTNESSCHVALRCGFSFDKRLSQVERIGGVLYDHNVYRKTLKIPFKRDSIKKE